ncbi:hypothetical protein J6590_048394, partial [Homalodisca vitripennis]
YDIQAQDVPAWFPTRSCTLTDYSCREATLSLSYTLPSSLDPPLINKQSRQTTRNIGQP